MVLNQKNLQSLSPNLILDHYNMMQKSQNPSYNPTN